MTLITGGARSGKSAFAEALIPEAALTCYLATNALSQDAEMHQRIKQHQKRRPTNWTTQESYLNLSEFILNNKNYKFFLLDCATMLTFNYVYYVMKRELGLDYQEADEAIERFGEDEKLAIEAEVIQEWQAILAGIQHSHAQTIIVTNEVGLGIVPEKALARWFRDIYGRVNQLLGKAADEAYFVMSGIPMKIK